MEKTIELKGVDLGVFFGPADTNLKIVEKIFQVELLFEGIKLKSLVKKWKFHLLMKFFMKWELP